MSLYDRNPQGPTLRLLLCIVAIVLGVLMFFNVVHVGAGHKGFGIVEVTVGLLLL